MAGPQPSSAVTRPDLRDSVYDEWDKAGELANYRGAMLCPIADVPTRSGTYKKIDREEFIKAKDTARRTGSYPTTVFGYTEANYNTKERGHQVAVEDSMAAEAAQYFDAEIEAAELALLIVNREFEKDCISLITGAGVTQTSAVTAAFSSHSTATPIADIRTASEAIWKSTGRWPNMVCMGKEAYGDLRECDEIIDKLGAFNSDDFKRPSDPLLAKIFDVAEVIVHQGLKDSADKGQTASLAVMWPVGTVLVGYVDPAPTLQGRHGLTLSRTLHWTGDDSERNFRTEEYYDEATRTRYIRARRHEKIELVEELCGYRLTGAHA